MAVTTKFDVPTVIRIIQLLENIGDQRISQSVGADEQEAKVTQAYQVRLKEVTEELGRD